MEAKVSADLLLTIFTPYSPLHDGAVLIRGDSIIAAGCILPAVAEAAHRPRARHPTPRGARAERRERCAGRGRERGAVDDLGGGARAAVARRRRRRSCASCWRAAHPARTAARVGGGGRPDASAARPGSAGAALLRVLPAHARAGRDVLGRGRVHRRGARPRDPAPAGDAAVRRAGARVDAAPGAARRCGARDESAVRRLHGARRRAHGGARRARNARACGRSRGERWPASLCAGLMASVWSNATETEVYAVSLLHVVVLLTCAARAGRSEGASARAMAALHGVSHRRWRRRCI